MCCKCLGDLEWRWKAEREWSNFQADLLYNDLTVWPRRTKFGMIKHAGRIVFLGQPRPYRKAAEPKHNPILRVLFSLCRRTTKFNVVTRGGGLCILRSATPPISIDGVWVSALPNFWGSPVFMRCLHPLTQNDQIRHGKTCGDGRVLGGQPPYCICTNALRVLSAIAKFLVDFWKLKTGF